MIEVDVDTREEEGWHEEVVYSKKGDHIFRRNENTLKYKLYDESKTWSDAEAQCISEGGHLASVLTQEEKRVAAAAAGVKNVWVGGTDP